MPLGRLRRLGSARRRKDPLRLLAEVGRQPRTLHVGRFGETVFDAPVALLRDLRLKGHLGLAHVAFGPQHLESRVLHDL